MIITKAFEFNAAHNIISDKVSDRFSGKANDKADDNTDKEGFGDKGGSKDYKGGYNGDYRGCCKEDYRGSNKGGHDWRGKCEKLHGHTYRLEVSLSGELDDKGMVEDFNEIERLIKEKILRRLDHSYINELIKQPTAENIAIWIWNELKDSFKRTKLHEIKVYESRDSFVAYRGEGD